MFRRDINRSAPPPRDAWADETKQKLDDIARLRKETVERSYAEEKLVRQRCNHTLPSGRSSMTPCYDDGDMLSYDGRGEYEQCEVCGFKS